MARSRPCDPTGSFAEALGAPVGGAHQAEHCVAWQGRLQQLGARRHHCISLDLGEKLYLAMRADNKPTHGSAVSSASERVAAAREAELATLRTRQEGSQQEQARNCKQMIGVRFLRLCSASCFKHRPVEGSGCPLDRTCRWRSGKSVACIFRFSKVPKLMNWHEATSRQACLLIEMPVGTGVDGAVVVHDDPADKQRADGVSEAACTASS